MKPVPYTAALRRAVRRMAQMKAITEPVARPKRVKPRRRQREQGKTEIGGLVLVTVIALGVLLGQLLYHAVMR